MAKKCENRISENGAGSKARKLIVAFGASPLAFLRLTLVSLAIGAATFAYKAYQPEEYQSEARILLLAPQEQYFPSVVGSLSLDKGTNSQTELADKLIADLKSPRILSSIVDQLHLTEDKSFVAVAPCRDSRRCFASGLFRFLPERRSLIAYNSLSVSSAWRPDA